MKVLIALILPAAIALFSLTAFAGVAPNSGSSAMSQSGAKIATPAKQSAPDREDKREHQDSAPGEVPK